jgi:spore coat polysaccharide biosynthesis predicted glycosyltransferase SpsG
MKRRYVFRADASDQMGSGHVMRVYSIIEKMLEENLDVILVGNIVGLPWLTELLDQMIGKIKLIEKENFVFNPMQDVLIIDSYTIKPNDDFLKKENWFKIVALVEIGTPKYLADLYIHCGTNKQIGLEFGISDNRLKSGLNYIPIRKSLKEIRFRLNEVNALDQIKILVVGGGTDPLGFVPKVARELIKLDEQFQAILFSNARNLLHMLDSRFIQRNIGSDLEKYLIDSDLVLTLSGTSSWEFLSCGFPLGIALGFDNQRDNFKFQTHNKIAIGIGNFSLVGGFNFNFENIRRLVKDRELRQELSQTALTKVDGFGVARILDEILKLN